MVSYRDNYERLATIKRSYDPTKFFRANQNIEPALSGFNQRFTLVNGMQVKQRRTGGGAGSR
jgi:hypothetical protein